MGVASNPKMKPSVSTVLRACHRARLSERGGYHDITLSVEFNGLPRLRKD